MKGDNVLGFMIRELTGKGWKKAETPFSSSVYQWKLRGNTRETSIKMASVQTET